MSSERSLPSRVGGAGDARTEDETRAAARAKHAGLLIFGAGAILVAADIALKLSVASPESGIYRLRDLAFIALGSIAVARQPRNRVSWLFAFVGLTFALLELCGQYANGAFAGQPDPPPAATLAAWVTSWAWPLSFGPLATLLLLWFPTGRLPSPRWRVVQNLAVGVFVGLPLLLAVAQDPESDSYPNPFATRMGTRLLESMMPVVSALFVTLVAASAWSLVVRFRRAGSVERQQLKWVIFGATLMALYMAADTILSDALGIETESLAWSVFEVVAFLTLPLGVAVAILRYRLYDIDVIINRALVYGSLTTALGVVYLSSIVLMQRVLPLGGDSDVAVAASTLAVAALFRPGRARVQRFIDRRFYRSRYDAALTLEDFSARLRNQVHLDALRDELTGTVVATMHPARASVWLREPEARS